MTTPPNPSAYWTDPELKRRHDNPLWGPHQRAAAVGQHLGQSLGPASRQELRNRRIVRYT
jgi:hypothetical protein